MKKLIMLTAICISINASAQNVGIGESTPNEAKLQIKNADSAIILLHNTNNAGLTNKSGLFFKTGTNYSGSIATIGSGATFRMGLFTYGGSLPSSLIERISILDAGNVGIGTINPLAKLDINGQIKISGGSPAAGRILESDATGLATWVDKPSGFLPTGVSGNTIRHNGTNFIATSNLYNDGSRIGLGTITPTSMLEIKSTTGTADIEINASAGDNAILRLQKNGATNYSTIRFKNLNINTWDLGTQGDENFKLRHFPTNATILDVDDVTKNMSIRTNDFTEQLNVGGNAAAFGAFISKSSTAGFLFQDRTANAYGGFNWYADAGKANLYRYGSGGDLLTIDAAGKLGLSVTTPTAPLSFPNTTGNKIALWGDATGGHYGLGIQGSLLQMYSSASNADIAFGHGSSSSLTERMRIKGTGEVGIGTSTPTTAGLVVNRVVGNTNAVFGSNTTGVSIQTSYPGIGFNTYYNGGSIMIASGGAGYIGADPTTGRIVIANTNANATAGSFNALQDKMWIANDGTVSMGSSNLNAENNALAAGYKLKVFGKIISEEVRVQLKTAWPDYVFEKNYKKLSLSELEKFVNENKHLPNIPSAAEVEKEGQHIGEIQRKVLEKIEELSLYIIELKKEMDILKVSIHK
jgi:hypothetical protein